MFCTVSPAANLANLCTGRDDDANDAARHVPRSVNNIQNKKRERKRESYDFKKIGEGWERRVGAR